ncbi:unnamed protein product, partial [Durusdinium trenchii]
MSGFASRRRRASRDGGRLRDPGDREGQLRVGAADERLDALLEEARATSMPPAVKRVGGVPAAADGRRTSAAAGRADGGRQPPLVERQERGAGWQETDFLDLYFMAAIQDTLALMIRDNLEGKGLGSGRQRHRLSFQFRREWTGELEAIRERILCEAHLNFEKEVKKLT